MGVDFLTLGADGRWTASGPFPLSFEHTRPLRPPDRLQAVDVPQKSSA